MAHTKIPFFKTESLKSFLMPNEVEGFHCGKCRSMQMATNVCSITLTGTFLGVSPGFSSNFTES